MCVISNFFLYYLSEITIKFIDLAYFIHLLFLIIKNNVTNLKTII
jgi:hypothetical protein